MTISTPVLNWQARFAASGIAMMVVSVLFSPMIDIFAKLAITSVPAGQIAAARFGVQVLCVLPFALSRGTLFSRSWRQAGFHALRGLLLVSGMTAFVYALKTMPVADAIAIFFVEPAILTILSAVFLHEVIGWQKIAACATGFGGSLLVIQPSFSQFGLVSLLPVFTALAVAIFLLTARMMSRTEDPWSMQFQCGFWALAASSALLFFGDGTGSELFDPAMPDWPTAIYLIAGGLTGTIASMLGVFAYRAAPASVLAPLQYLEIVSAAIVAYFVFGDFPDLMKWVGIVIIVASGVYIIWRGDSSKAAISEASI